MHFGSRTYILEEPLVMDGELQTRMWNFEHHTRGMLSPVRVRVEISGILPLSLAKENMKAWVMTGLSNIFV